jgi:hypothetical protein
LNELEQAASVALHHSSWQTGLSPYAWPVQRSLETGQRLIDEDSPCWNDTRRMFLAISVGDTDPFFVYAFKYPLYSYVQYRLSNGQSFDTKIDNQNSLLTSAAVAMDLKMLQLLFRSGASPNTPGKGYTWTPWQQVLYAAKNDTLGAPKVAVKWAEIVKIFLDHGADPSAECKNKTAKAIIKERFQTWDPKWTQETLSTLEALKRSQKATKRYSHAFQGLFKRGDDKK